MAAYDINIFTFKCGFFLYRQLFAFDQATYSLGKSNLNREVMSSSPKCHKRNVNAASEQGKGEHVSSCCIKAASRLNHVNVNH